MTLNLNKLKLIALDSNILIYYFEKNPEFGENSKIIFDLLIRGQISCLTSILSITEALSKATIPEKIAKELENSIFDIPRLSVFEVNRKIASEAARIKRKYNFRLPDAIQLATARLSKAKAFISNDEKLKKFKELKIILIKEVR